jgi:hypothetical protein
MLPRAQRRRHKQDDAAIGIVVRVDGAECFNGFAGRLNNLTQILLRLGIAAGDCRLVKRT